MPYTTLGDLFARDRVTTYEVLQSYMDADPVTVTPFFESGILTSNPLLAEAAASGTGIVEMPYWLGIDSSIEPNYSNDVYEDVAVPRSIGTGYLRGRNAYLNEGFGTMSLVNEIRGRDPLARVASRLDQFWREQAERRLVATMRGIFLASEADDLGFVATGAVGLEGIIDATMTMGDNFGAIAGYVMHSADFATFAKADLTEVRRNRETNLLERTINGLPVIVNDQAMVIGTGPTARRVIGALGTGAFGYGSALPAVPLEYEREAARGNGGGAETLWTRRNMIVHPIGFDFTSDSITGNGTEGRPRSAGWTDLTNPVNWELAEGVERKKVPIAFLAAAA
ncbi:phage major capsid protein [Aureimonas fodinaquatilis]|uniref:Phage major capsid protein n=1 Tax=Aureimonas fodinaquatilis TaxID=2565783 RepID=A0A5B0DU68_9HYPH|nr:phage major capsid protein [Aureimonas fodinaquatilis]KAA0970304.1 phage major capsid protein [Aureimonas fodinaquatilis]